MKMNENRSIFITLHKTQVEVHERLQHKIRYTNFNRNKMVNILELIGIGDNLLNRTPMALARRSAINKWNLMKLKSFWKTKDTVSGSKWKLMPIRVNSLPNLHIREV